MRFHARFGSSSLRASAGGASGQSLLEAALALPVFLLLFFGLVDLSRAVYISHHLAALARDGARAAIVAPQNCQQVAQVVRAHASLVDLSAPGAVQLTAPQGLAVGRPVNVAVQTRYVPTNPLIAALLGGAGFTLYGQSTMAIQFEPAGGATPCT